MELEQPFIDLDAPLPPCTFKASWEDGKCPANNYSVYEKHWLGAAAWRKFKTIQQLSAQFEISQRTLYRYMAKYINGLMCRLNGRPSMLSEDQVKVLHGMVRSGHYVNTIESLHQLMQDMAQQHIELFDTKDAKWCARTQRYYISNLLDCKSIKVETTAAARAEAIEDKRHALTYAVMLNLFVANSSKSLLVNMDSTQFKVGCTTDGTERCAVPRDMKGKAKAREEKKDKTGMAFFIKSFLVIAADGTYAEPVYLIADGTMKKEDCVA